MMRLLLIAVLSLALSACWMGDGLYSAKDARQPIPAGIYKTINTDGDTRIENVSVLADGLTKIGDGDGAGLYGFAPLDNQDRRFVVWFHKDEETSSDHAQLYMLLEKRSNDEFALYLPSCKDAEGEIAKRAGATLEEGTTDVCHFHSRASLENAMRQIGNLDEVIRIVRYRGK